MMGPVTVIVISLVCLIITGILAARNMANMTGSTFNNNEMPKKEMALHVVYGTFMFLFTLSMISGFIWVVATLI